MAYDDNGNYLDDQAWQVPMTDPQFLTPQSGPWTGQSQGNADASAAAGAPVNLPIEIPPVAQNPWTKTQRNQVRDDWMSGSGSLDDFYKNSAYKDHMRVDGDHLFLNPTSDDKYGSMGDENIDAVLDFGPGGQNKHVWTGQGPGSGGGDGGSGGAGGLGGAGGAGGLNIPPLDPELMSMFKTMASHGSSSTTFSKDLEDALSRTLRDGPTGGPMSAQQFESIRQPIEKGRRAQTNQAMSELASRGLLGEGGGHQQGPERTALDRIESNIAPDWATALQGASVDNAKLSTGLFEHALDAGGQRASAMDSNALGALKGGADYQGMNADVALKGLDQNRQWNQFLAQFGLDRERVMADIKNGSIANLVPLLKLFSENNNTSANGYVG